MSIVLVMVLVLSTGMFAFTEDVKASDLTPRETLVENLLKTTNEAIDLIALYSENFESVDILAPQAASGVVSYRASVDEAVLEDLADALYMPKEYIPIAKLLADLGFDIGFDLDLSGLDPQMKLNLALLLQDETMLSLDSLLLKNAVYFKLPELLSNVMAVELDEFDIDVKDVMDQANDEMTYSIGVDYDEMMSSILPLFNYIEKYSDEIKPMIRDIVETAIAEIKNIDYDEQVSLDLNGAEVECDTITIALTEEDMYNMGIACANLLLENRDYMRIIVDLVNTANEYTDYSITGSYENYTVAELKEELEYIVEDEYTYFSDEEIVVVYYLNSDATVSGYSVGGDFYGGFSFLMDQNKGFEYILDDDGEILRLYGELNTDSDIISGDMWLEYTPGYWYDEDYDIGAFNIKIMEYEGINPDIDSGIIEQKFSMACFLGEILSVAGEEALYDIPAELHGYLLESIVKLSMDYNEESAVADIELLMGDGFAVSLAFKVNAEADTDATIADSSDIIYINEELFNNFDVFMVDIMENIDKLMVKIGEMGYNLDFVDSIIESAFSELE